MGDGLPLGDEMGGDVSGVAALRQAQRPPQELHPVARRPGDGNVPKVQAGDALHGHLRRGRFLAEGQVCQNTGLAPGVDALHIGGGVGLGVAFLLRSTEGVPEGLALLRHLGEDIVGGAVEDAVDLLDPVGPQAIHQGVQQGDAPAHAGLKEVPDTVLLRQLQKLPAMLRHQLLVGGDHMLPGHQAAPSVVQGCVHAADDLHRHGNFRILRDVLDAVRHPVPPGALPKAPDQDAFQGDLLPQPGGDGLPVLLQHPGDAAAHRAEAQYRDLCHGSALSPP